MGDYQKDLVEMIRTLSAADLSVLQATLVTPDSQIATVAGSPNDVLWSALVERGMARELSLDLEVPLPAHLRPKTFALTAAGRAALPGLLAKTLPEKP